MIEINEGYRFHEIFYINKDNIIVMESSKKLQKKST